MAQLAVIAGALGLGKEAIKPVTQIIFVILGVIVLLLAASILSSYHLITAAVFFIMGALLVYLITMNKQKEVPTLVYLLPFIAGIIGYVFEMMSVLAVPTDVVLPFNDVSEFGDISLPIGASMMGISMFVFIIGIVIRKRRR